MASPGLIARLRDTAARWRSALSAAGIAAVCEIGARIGIPGVDGEAVQHFINAGHSGLIWLYNFVAGGGTSRAALLALGVLPYLSARLYLGLGRSVSASVRLRTDDDHTKSRVLRIMTAGLAGVQAFGYATFLSTIPGAVANPGVGFLARTVLLLTASSIVAGLLLEQMTKPADNADAASPAASRELPLQSSERELVRAAAGKASQAERA